MQPVGRRYKFPFYRATMTTDHPNPSKPRRRWFQYSLRTLLVLVTVQPTPLCKPAVVPSDLHQLGVPKI